MSIQLRIGCWLMCWVLVYLSKLLIASLRADNDTPKERNDCK